MNLNEIRQNIDEVDRQIAELMEARMDLVLQIAEYKKSQNLEILDSSREHLVLEKIAGYVKNPAYTDTIVTNYQDIMKNSRSFQEKLLKK
ncbi:chorismate mutase [Lactococcus nasutitermitis]|uniref:Chorismate mutase n=1 Tax=Lactococcus nasutitermitis TaxID=1652957 RepID=A0ABV9JEP1_9LACT|nr:chorismate mutase [Lactococcus nasutitermitis]